MIGENTDSQPTNLISYSSYVSVIGINEIKVALLIIQILDSLLKDDKDISLFKVSKVRTQLNS